MENYLKKPFKYSFFNATYYIIGANLIFFMINMLIPKSVYFLAMVPSFVLHGFVWQFVTYMFVHGGISHIAFNMLALFFFGSVVERRIGSREFILFYFLTGILAGVFSFIVFYLSGRNVILLGASGAIFAVLLAYAVYFPDSRVFVFGLIPMKATTLVLLYTGIELLSQLRSPNGGVSHLTHLAGFAFAFLYFIIRHNINPIDVFRGNNSGRSNGGYW